MVPKSGTKLWNHNTHVWWQRAAIHHNSPWWCAKQFPIGLSILFIKEVLNWEFLFQIPQKPYLEIRVKNLASESRRKRMTSLTCEEKSTEVRCCRYPLTVDFEKFGWDWIIAPKQYEANYCSGECSYVFLPHYPHTHLVQQTSLSNVIGPCCSPRKMNAISMLYLDDKHNIIYGILPNMVVDRCGCS